MGRGIVGGLIWGMIVSSVILTAVSLSLPLPERTETGQPTPTAANDPVPQSQLAPVKSDAPAAQASSTDATQAPLNAPPKADEATIAAVEAVVIAPEPPAPAIMPEVVPEPAQLSATPPAATVAAPPVPLEPQLSAQAPRMPSRDMQGEQAPLVPAPEALMTQTQDARPAAIDHALPIAPVPELAPLPAPVAQAAPRGLPNPAPLRVLPQVAPPMAATPDPMAPPAAPELPPPAPSTDLAPPASDTVAQGALDRNAVAFEADPARPLMSIILIDDPNGPLGADVLAQITFPMSFAIDPQRPDAELRANQLREAGFEVLILAAAAIPEGARPSDVAVSLAAAQQVMPQAVAMIDSPESRIQADRPVLEAVIAGLVDSGHGLVAFPRNLNAAEQSARRDGVPAATAFRLLDDADQSAPVITRYLDRASFAAGQEGAVIVVGKSRPDTVTAVFSWALGGRAEGVMLAPVSAVLRRLSE